MVPAFGDKGLARSFKNVSLSHKTVAKREAELNDNVILQYEGVVQQCKYFFLALKESTDISDISKLQVLSEMLMKTLMFFCFLFFTSIFIILTCRKVTEALYIGQAITLTCFQRCQVIAVR